MDKSKPLSAFISNPNKQREINGNSKKQLNSQIENRIKTTFIGAIDSFEKAFGHLWGINKKQNERTEEEKQMYSLWLDVRHEILDKGNTQLRVIGKDLDNYTVSFNGIKTILRIKENE